MNTVRLIGKLEKSPTITVTRTGETKAKFLLGVGKRFTSPNGKVTEKMEYISIVSFGDLAKDVGSQLTKGNRVYVEGRYSIHSHSDSNGYKRYITEILATIIAKPL